MKNFADLITQERERLTQEEENITSQIAELQTKLAAIAKERRAIDAYEAAKEDRPARTRKTSTRSPRGSKRDELLAIIKENPGITRAQIIEKLNIKTDKAAQGTMSNALTTMKKVGTISLEGGRYTAA